MIKIDNDWLVTSDECFEKGGGPKYLLGKGGGDAWIPFLGSGTTEAIPAGS